MLSLKTKQTNRKFYGKWIYKTTLNLEGCSLFRTKSIDEIIEFCLGPDDTKEHHRYSIYSKAYNNKEKILDICNFLKTQDIKNYSTRIENKFIDFYSNDKQFYEQLSSNFESIVKHRFEPEQSDLAVLENSAYSITVKKLPKNRYNYRVYLLPHKLAKDIDAKRKYINWLKSQDPRITCTDAVEKWFINTDWNWDRRYVLVEDEATLLMMKLRNSEVVGRIYNFVLSDK